MDGATTFQRRFHVAPVRILRASAAILPVVQQHTRKRKRVQANPTGIFSAVKPNPRSNE